MTKNNSNGGVEVAEVGRKIFTVELRQGETTIVSWKKLLKDAARAAAAAGEASTSSPSTSSSLASAYASQPPPPATTDSSNPVIHPPLPPGQSADNELKDGHPSRFGAVIEKIERLYMGKHSSDEEDLNDVPDDDEYDTEDSFIDDAELDDYFQVDNSAIKHDGFFVNRGKLERKNESTSLPSQQAKKRRRKDLVDNNSDELPNKLVKVENGVDRKFKKLVKKNISIPHVVALPSPRCEEMNLHNQTNTSVTCAKKKYTETKTSLASSISSNVEMPNASLLKSYDKSVLAKIKSGSAILSKINGELGQSVRGRDKEGNLERLDLNFSAGKVPKQNQKAPVLQRKEGYSIKPKSAVLEKTIGELEKMVTESRPPSARPPLLDVQDDETSQGAGKRRLPRELKQKLAKVARLAEAIHGRIPEELVNRLMCILGHLLQVKTLKRNLKDMVTMGLIAKKEKDDRVQQMKKEVSELIKNRVPYINSKILEHQTGESGDFQEMTKEEKDTIKRKYGMDNAIEDKISELYDLCVDSLDEDAGPQARRLYAELAHLWPEGFMDNHGIKRAICRSKDRRLALYGRSKDQEAIKKKKLVANTEGTVRAATSSVALPHHTQDKPLSEPNTNGLNSCKKPLINTASTNPSVRLASSSPDAPNPAHPKQDKVKVKSSSSNLNEKVQMDVMVKKKMKRKPETEIVGGQTREKPVSLSGYEKGKSHKQVVGPLLKPSASFSTSVNLNNPSNMS